MYPPDRPTNYPPAPQAILPTSTLAVVSLVTGVLGFGVIPVLGSIIALITGYMARKETRAVPPVASGDGMATAGIIMGYVQLVLLVIGACCVVAGLLFPAIFFFIPTDWLQ
jgi:hypothetical protein